MDSILHCQSRALGTNEKPQHRETAAAPCHRLIKHRLVLPSQWGAGLRCGCPCGYERQVETAECDLSAGQQSSRRRGASALVRCA